MNKPFAHASAANLSGRHLLGIEGLSVPEIQALLSRSSHFADVLTGKEDDSPSKLLKGTSVVNLFFENSTRTRVSFEVAAKHLGGGSELVCFRLFCEKRRDADRYRCDAECDAPGYSGGAPPPCRNPPIAEQICGCRRYKCWRWPP